MDFTIDCEKWRCGKDGKFRLGEGKTYLLNSQGFMCCLGQCELQLGLTKDQIIDKFFPRSTGEVNILAEEVYPLPYVQDTDFAEKAMEINDDSEISNRKRMKLLKEHFEKYGHTIKFINQKALS